MTAPPRVFRLDPQALAAVRVRALNGDAALLPALAALRHEADAALSAGPFTVMDKEALPLSGDRHDYVSYGPYWWPDPSAPGGLPYIRRDGERNPEVLDGARSDSPRLKALATAVDALALAWYLADDRVRYAEHAALLLRTWFVDPATRMNPHLEYGQAIPGVVDGRGIGIIDTSCLVGLVDSVGLLGLSPAWGPGDQSALEAWFAEYLEWLLASSHGQDERHWHNNHGTWYDAQVASFALFTGQTDLARETIADSAVARIGAHITPDGRQPHEMERTKAFDYSVFNLNAFCALAGMAPRSARTCGATAPRTGSIRTAIDWLAPTPTARWTGRTCRSSRSTAAGSIRFSCGPGSTTATLPTRRPLPAWMPPRRPRSAPTCSTPSRPRLDARRPRSAAARGRRSPFYPRVD